MAKIYRFPADVKYFTLNWELGDTEPKLEVLVENDNDPADIHEYFALVDKYGAGVNVVTIMNGYVMNKREYYAVDRKIQRVTYVVKPVTMLFSRANVEEYYKCDENRCYKMVDILDDLSSKYGFLYAGTFGLDSLNPGERFDAVGSLKTVLEALAERFGYSTVFYTVYTGESGQKPMVVFMKDPNDVSPLSSISIPGDKFRLVKKAKDGDNIYSEVIVSTISKRNAKKEITGLTCQDLKNGIVVDLVDDKTQKKYALESINSIVAYVRKKKKIKVYVDNWSGTQIEGSIHVKDTRTHNHTFSGSDTVTISDTDTITVDGTNYTVSIYDTDTVNISGTTSDATVTYETTVTSPSDDVQLNISGVAEGYVWVDFMFSEAVECDYEVVDWVDGKVKIFASGFDCDETSANPDVLEVAPMNDIKVVIDFSIARRERVKVQSNTPPIPGLRLTYWKFVEGILDADENDKSKLQSIAQNLANNIGSYLETYEFDIPTLTLINSVSGGTSDLPLLFPGRIIEITSGAYAGQYMVVSYSMTPSLTTIKAVRVGDTNINVNALEDYRDSYLYRLYRQSVGGLLPSLGDEHAE